METIDLLDGAWRAWAEVDTLLDDARWGAPTRLPGWTVVDVYAHHSVFPTGILRAVREPVDALPTHPNAGALLAMFNADPDAHRIASAAVCEHAVDRARRHSRAALVDQFRITAPEALRAARDAGLHRMINYSGVAILPIGQALRIALMEAVVHYLDIARAAELPVPGPMAGGPLHAAAALLVEVADPLAFVERATGRSGGSVLPVIR